MPSQLDTFVFLSFVSHAFILSALWWKQLFNWFVAVFTRYQNVISCWICTLMRVSFKSRHLRWTLLQKLLRYVWYYTIYARCSAVICNQKDISLYFVTHLYDTMFDIVYEWYPRCWQELQEIWTAYCKIFDVVFYFEANSRFWQNLLIHETYCISSLKLDDIGCRYKS